MISKAAVWLATGALVVGISGVARATPGLDPPRFRPGAPSIGDPYFPLDGNSGYDVEHYDLDLRFDPATHRIEGRATIRARATQDLSQLDLDLDGLTVRSVAVQGRGARWHRSAHKLVVAPERGIGVGRAFTTVVRYDGVPTRLPEGGGFLPTADGAIVAGEPHGASTWYPVNDHPRDKATYTFAITVPAGVEVVANGTLEGLRTTPDGVRWLWQARSPMASYLATIDIGHFDLHATRRGGIRLVDALDPSLFARPGTGTGPGAPHRSAGQEARAALDREPAVLDKLAARFGRYPFADAGGIVVDAPGLNFALETQTRPVYSSAFFATPDRATTVIVHELAHQWFGDSVSLDTWRDIWLNEGFATYAEWLWSEQEGLGTAQQHFDALYAAPARAALWRVEVGDPGPRSLFNGAVYDRGAMTLHQLRLAVGDAAFFTILRRWAADNAGGNATTAQFIALADQVAGHRLDGLFHDWLFTTSKPALSRAAALRSGRLVPLLPTAHQMGMARG